MCERERVRRECACERSRAYRGRPAAPTAAGAGHARPERAAEPAPAEPAGTRAETPAPHPPPSSLGSPSPGGNLPTPAGLCPAALLDVPGALARPPPAAAASVALVLRPAGVERAGSRGLAAARASPVPTPAPGPPTQLSGLGGCDNGL